MHTEHMMEDHSGHGGHGGHDMPGMPMPDMGPKCDMNMLWNTQIADTCVVFRQWHISSTGTLLLSMLAIIALGAFYEWLRSYAGAVDRRIARKMLVSGKGKGRRPSSGRSTPEAETSEEVGLLGDLKGYKAGGTVIPWDARILRASLYGATVFLSFFLMLVFMTYNAYLIAAVVIGAAVGNYVFSPTMDIDAVLSGAGAGKGMACH